MGSDQTDVALQLARIEGKLDATLPELATKSNQLSTDLSVLHGRVTQHGHQLAGHKERIEDLEERTRDLKERSRGSLGRLAQIVAIVGGSLGVLGLIVSAFAPA